MPTPAGCPASFRPGPLLDCGVSARQADSVPAQSASSPQELRSVSSLDCIMPHAPHAAHAYWLLPHLVRTWKRSRGSQRPRATEQQRLSAAIGNFSSQLLGLTWSRSGDSSVVSNASRELS